jgi:hypothetical protein
MNKKDLMKVGVGVGVLALLYFAFKKKGTTTKSSTTANSSISTQTDMSKTGDEKIKALVNDLETNEPKSTEEAKARMKKFGVSQLELDAFLAKAFSMPQKKMNQFSSFVGDDGSKKRESLRRQYGLSFEDDKKLSRVIKITNGSLNRDGITNPQEREALIDKRLKSVAKSQNLNLRAFYLVEAGMQEASSQLIQRKRSFASFDSVLSEERTSGNNSRIKPTSVSGLAIAKRPRNYGTAQRPTRKLTPISVRIGDSMDFDGNEDALGNVM